MYNSKLLQRKPFLGNSTVELLLCAATNDGKKAALEVSYFKAVKASLVKLDTRGGRKKTKQEMEARINQLYQKK